METFICVIQVSVVVLGGLDGWRRRLITNVTPEFALLKFEWLFAPVNNNSCTITLSYNKHKIHISESWQLVEDWNKGWWSLYSLSTSISDRLNVTHCSLADYTLKWQGGELDQGHAYLDMEKHDMWWYTKNPNNTTTERQWKQEEYQCLDKHLKTIRLKERSNRVLRILWLPQFG